MLPAHARFHLGADASLMPARWMVRGALLAPLEYLSSRRLRNSDGGALSQRGVSIGIGRSCFMFFLSQS